MKRFLILMALAASLLLSGCARGEITVELSRLGAADLTAKLVTLPILQPTAETFEEDFKKDGYTVQKVDEGEYKALSPIVITTSFRTSKNPSCCGPMTLKLGPMRPSMP